jgi:hypothetical protein
MKRDLVKYNAWQRAYTRRHPEKRKDQRLKKMFGISLEQYNEMLAAQGNLCVICGSETKLVVDHCHTTGKVRGLLCQLCNSVIGMAREDIGVLKKAIKYLGG